MDNLFLFPEFEGGKNEQPNNLQLATVAGVYEDGLALIPDAQAAATQKHYKYLASAYPAPAVGDRVVVMKMSGTYVVMGSLYGSSSLPAANTVFAGPASGETAAAAFRHLVATDLPTVPISKGGTGQSGVTVITDPSEIFVMASGFSCNWANYAAWGKIAMVTASFRVVQAVTTSSWTTWATIVAGKRPLAAVVGNITRTSYCTVGSDGTIDVASTISADGNHIFTAVYLLP